MILSMPNDFTDTRPRMWYGGSLWLFTLKGSLVSMPSMVWTHMHHNHLLPQKKKKPKYSNLKISFIVQGILIPEGKNVGKMQCIIDIKCCFCGYLLFPYNSSIFFFHLPLPALECTRLCKAGTHCLRLSTDKSLRFPYQNYPYFASLKHENQGSEKSTWNIGYYMLLKETWWQQPQ